MILCLTKVYGRLFVNHIPTICIPCVPRATTHSIQQILDLFHQLSLIRLTNNEQSFYFIFPLVLCAFENSHHHFSELSTALTAGNSAFVIAELGRLACSE